jgi:hypothetical protein
MKNKIKKINVHRDQFLSANIDQLSLTRDWLDETHNRHAYHCFPMSLVNRLGWGISFPQDISFTWDGITDTTPDHIKILKGGKYVYTGRGNATVSFNTGINFSSDENVSLLTMPVPNQFIDGASCISTIVSTSVLVGEMPIAWKITRPNTKITIPANTPIAAILPISVNDLQDNYELNIFNRKKEESPEYRAWITERSSVSMSKNSKGDWTHFYRDAVDHLGNPFGKHETKKIILKTKTIEE